MASKLMKRCIEREAIVQRLAFDKTPGARKARMAKTTGSQWHKRVTTNVTGFYKPENARC